ncbi:hypothetical protein CfE428DRAFT_4045 [Chthoniobacter flavus Ellin428]|uniref:Glycosyltransferase RgtA/B/C/D-like domain-containing protein n=1 Tax=Chthoniobacter flavus Ellin428 TaxID=497964 RepID=B4D556_9BACT|nr:hypothetical protein CfE428DRAFT_4045 [Chthoniobacter flavus Ellin428]TCO91291.1 hypothetical protein EV701_10816 [Chthoniobacter flavus]
MEPPVSSPVADGGLETPAPSAAVSASTDVSWKQTFREVLRWCLPALLIGFAIRAAVMWCMPNGYVQYDSSDYLVTTQRIIEDHHFYIHHKRSYLTPVLFSAAFLLPAPATVTIAVAQHVMGLIAILIVGALVRFWFRFWRVAIIPVTILFGANPFIIWYEHTIMGEAQFLFFTLVMLLAGTLLARRPTLGRLAWFMVSLVLVFGTRLESKTFLLFAGLLTFLVFWKQWWRMAVAVAAVVITFQVAFHVGGDRDVSSLVYASLIRFAPTESATEPGIMPRILPIRQKARARSVEFPTQLVRVSKDINTAVGNYVAERFQGRKKQAPEEARIVRGLCLETLKAEPVKTLMEPWIKFRLAVDAWSAYCWDKRSLWENQREALTMKDWMTTVLGHGLTGRPITLEQIPDWLKEHYRSSKVAWFTRYQKNWNKYLIHFRMPDRHLDQKRWVHDFYGGVGDWRHTLPGVPFFYILGFLGMFAAILRPSQLRPFHFAWVLTVLGGLYVSCMVGVTNGRFRFVYEPFFLLYFFFLFDYAADLWKGWRDRRVTSRACST